MIEMMLRVKDKDLPDQERLIVLIELGIGYARLGKIGEAIACHQAALVLARKNKAVADEATALGNLAGCFSALGDIRKAIEFSDQALAMDRMVKYRYGEASDLQALGLDHADLGDCNKALEFYRESLRIHRQVHRIADTTVVLENMGDAYLDLGSIEEAIGCYLEALKVAEQIGYTQTLSYARWGLAQAYLLKHELAQAENVVSAAETYDVPINNFNISVLRGILALRQAEQYVAQRAFAHSIAQADILIGAEPNYYDALYAKVLGICGLLLCDGNQHISEAKETIANARKITHARGIIKRELRLFDELSQCDTQGALKQLRPLIEGSE